ncbi:MAG: hypothetical protein M1318_06340 [Firmicutes bacterium]|jgi:hypothetical protein|nr:hypothetical protein [Bacillota bacterium]
MRPNHGFGAMILAVILLAVGGCGITNSQPAPPPAKQSSLISSQGLQDWSITFTPDLNVNIQYLGHPMFSSARLTLFTKYIRSKHWHRFYTTGQGIIQYREWGSAFVHGESFVGEAKLVIKWVTGTHPHKGYALYQVRILKHFPPNTPSTSSTPSR